MKSKKSEKNKKSMKRKIVSRVFLLISIIASLYFIPWDILYVRLMPHSETIEEELELVEKYGFDGIIVHLNDGDNQYTYSSGYKDRDSKALAQGDELFRIASISKLYMATAAAKLIEGQVLSLDDTLADLLPEYKEAIQYADQITLKMLIQHRSGIPDFVDNKDYPWGDLPKSQYEALQYAINLPAEFKPDKKYDYSNTNYLLLGQIMDDALGYSHETYVKDEILSPLELSNTYFNMSEINIEDLMSGYDVSYPLDLKENEHVTPGGSMIASVQDVAIFLRALIKGNLLTDQEQAIYSEIYAYEHTGLLAGYQSIARYEEDTDTVIIVFVNTSGGTSWSKMEILYDRIVDILKQ